MDSIVTEKTLFLMKSLRPLALSCVVSASLGVVGGAEQIPTVAPSGLPCEAVGEIRFGPVGRALIMGSNRGMLRVYAERAGGKLLGASMVAPRGEHLAHLLAWAIERGLTAVDMLRVPYYHPAMEEALQGAIRALLDDMGTQSSDSPELQPLTS